VCLAMWWGIVFNDRDLYGRVRFRSVAVRGRVLSYGQAVGFFVEPRLRGGRATSGATALTFRRGWLLVVVESGAASGSRLVRDASVFFAAWPRSYCLRSPAARAIRSAGSCNSVSELRASIRSASLRGNPRAGAMRRFPGSSSARSHGRVWYSLWVSARSHWPSRVGEHYCTSFIGRSSVGWLAT